MISLFDMFKVGIGPSSSHTVGFMRAGRQFVDDLAEKGLLDSVTRVVMDVYGSLSLTGKGHHTDIAIIVGLAGNEPATVDIDSIPDFIRDVEECESLLLAQGRHEADFLRDNGMRFHSGNPPLHENGMQIHAYNGDEVVCSKTYYSVGDGFVVDEEHFGQDAANEASVPHPFKSTTELLAYCDKTSHPLSGFVMQNGLALHSKKETDEYSAHVWQTMQACIDRGISIGDVLPGPLRVPRCASVPRRILVFSDKLFNDPMNVIGWINMFALAVNEENAVGGRVVTASTNGACGIVPVVLAYHDHLIKLASPDIYTRYFMAAGAIDALYRMNAFISGAEIGCQGEVGVACPMAVAGLVELLDGSPEQVCVTAETGMEYNLGLACDPAAGQVQVSCIERNTVASVRATSVIWMVPRCTGTSCVPLDKIIEMMYETGKDMNAKYRKTSRGGLAIKVRRD